MQAALIAALALGAATLGLVIGRATDDPEALTATVLQTSTVTRTITRTETASVERVFVPLPTGQLEYKPDSFPVGASNGVEDIHWDSYGGESASGSGYTYISDCDPNCAEGKTERVRVQFRLFDVGACNGTPIYRKLRIDHPKFPHDELDVTPFQGCD